MYFQKHDRGPDALTVRDLGRLDAVMRAAAKAKAPVADQVAARFTFFQAVVSHGATYQLDALGQRLAADKSAHAANNTLSDASFSVVFDFGPATLPTLRQLVSEYDADPAFRKAMDASEWGSLISNWRTAAGLPAVAPHVAKEAAAASDQAPPAPEPAAKAPPAPPRKARQRPVETKARFHFI